MADSFSKALLVILDGFGIADNPEVSAVDKAQTPFIDQLFDSCPHAKLSASGEDVGLPAGQFGNSEVGHMNIGAGRIVRQELSRINNDIETGAFLENEAFLKAANQAKENNRIHIMGLFSDGGVHSHINHLFALLKLIEKEGIDNAYVHAFTDGRDTSPEGGINYVKDFEAKADAIGVGQIASIVGRYYAMDRDERWDRTQKAYDLLVDGKGSTFESAADALRHSYDEDVTDEFVEPVAIGSDVEDSRIKKGDVVLFYNFRGDRARQITRAFTEPGFDKFPIQPLDLNYYTFTSYDDNFENLTVAYPPPNLKNTLGEVVSNQGVEQLRIAETEKYAHVTYFLNGGREEPFEGEKRIIVPSPKVATYDLQPEMSAPKVAEELCNAITENELHLGVLNFANPDMVGHTGDMDAAIKAVETVDTQLKKVVAKAKENAYKILIIADHGNADQMEQPDGSPHTAHTTSLVPAILVGADDSTQIHDGILADVAPTLLKMMNIAQPEEMSGKPLY